MSRCHSLPSMLLACAILIVVAPWLRAQAESSRPEEIGVLLNQLESETPGSFEYDQAVDALAQLGERAVPSLIGALEADSPAVRQGAYQALARMGEEAQAAVPALIRHMQSGSASDRRAAREALARVVPEVYGEGVTEAPPQTTSPTLKIGPPVEAATPRPTPPPTTTPKPTPTPSSERASAKSKGLSLSNEDLRSSSDDDSGDSKSSRGSGERRGRTLGSQKKVELDEPEAPETPAVTPGLLRVTLDPVHTIQTRGNSIFEQCKLTNQSKHRILSWALTGTCLRQPMGATGPEKPEAIGTVTIKSDQPIAPGQSVRFRLEFKKADQIRPGDGFGWRFTPKTISVRTPSWRAVNAAESFEVVTVRLDEKDD